MIDTHCHLTYSPLLDRLDAVLVAAKRSGVDAMISVGTTPEDAQLAVELSTLHKNVFASVGVHPHYADRDQDQSQVIESLSRLMVQPGVVAIGEMGLDRHYPDPPIAQQIRLFDWQLQWATEVDHPIIIHNREATDEVLRMIVASGIPGQRFVFHCFTGSAAELESILAIGAMVSFTGVITFKNSTTLADCLKMMPLDRMMVETDSPYLTPEPHRKVRPNEPCYVVDVARFIAGRLEIALDKFTMIVDGNAKRFFRLPID